MEISTICESELVKKAKGLTHQYHSNVNDEYLAEEIKYLPVAHRANFGKPELQTLELLHLLT